jgi:hypothetical protein
VFAHSRRAGFDFEPFSLWSMLEEHAGGRFILTEQQGEDGRLKVLAWGKGYRSFNKDWTTNAVGRDFEDQPDASYAKWAAASYKAANAAGAPIVEDVEASTWWPGRGRTRLRYTRLVLPLTLHGRRRVLLSTAQSTARP